MAFYRVKLFTAREYHKDDKEYCLDKNLVGIGWGNDECSNINDYIANVVPEKQSGRYKNQFRYPYKCMCDMTKDDYVWTKIDGLNYALGKIQSNLFIDESRPRMGAVRVCNWKRIDFDKVPGKVTNYFVGGGRTLVKMNINKSLEEYCKWLYCIEDADIESLNLNDLIHYDDLEDLLGLYLQSKGYYIYPSTNKLSAKLIEYELVHKFTGEKACVQCKTGNCKVTDKVIKEIYKHFKDYKIFISTTTDENFNDGNKVETIFTKDLWEMAYLHKNILPKRIQNFINLANV